MNELSVLEVKLGTQEGIKLNTSMGSLFHGAVMEKLDSEYAEFLHCQSLRPYSQCVYFDYARQSWYWRLGSLDKVARENILETVNNLQEALYIKHKQLEVELLEKNFIAETTHENLMDRFFGSNMEVRRIKFDFLTPASFKKDGNYMIFPQPQQLIGSLLNKWNVYAEKYAFEEQNIVENLASEVFVTDYNLRMQGYYLEGVRVPAFKGYYTIGLKGNRMANRIIGLLSEYAQFSGIGIKTALGMGAVRCEFL